MNRTATTSLLATAALAVLAAPAGADKPTDPGTSNVPASAQTPGPEASQASKAKAYGKKCQGTSRKSAEGQAKSPFALCVTALAKSQKQGEADAADGAAASYAARKRAAKQACKAVPKTKLAGATKTQYALCVTAAAKLRREAAAVAA